MSYIETIVENARKAQAEFELYDQKQVDAVVKAVGKVIYDNAEMIADFWMPNKNWEGCNVNDPSARVLKNYGDSGK